MADKPRLIEGTMSVAAHEVLLNGVNYGLSVVCFVDGQLQGITALEVETARTVFVNGRIELLQSDGSWFYTRI